MAVHGCNAGRKETVVGDVTFDEVLASMTHEDRVWVKHLQKTRESLHISNAGNLCSHGFPRRGKPTYPIVWNTAGLGDRRTRKHAAMKFRDELRATAEPPGVIHSVRVDIVLDV